MSNYVDINITAGRLGGACTAHQRLIISAICLLTPSCLKTRLAYSYARHPSAGREAGQREGGGVSYSIIQLPQCGLNLSGGGTMINLGFVAL